MGRFKAAAKLISKAWWTVWEGEQDTKAVATKTDDAPSPFTGWQFGLAVTAGVLFAGLFIVGLTTNHDVGGWIERLFDADWWQAIAAWASVIVALIAVRYVSATLRETRQMVKDTKEIGDRQTDAWVAVEELIIDEGSGSNIRIRFVNFGNTAAIKFGYRIDSQHVTGLNKNEPRPVNTNNLTANSVISPNREFFADYYVGSIPSVMFGRPHTTCVIDVTFTYTTRSGRVEYGISSFNIFGEKQQFGLQGMQDMRAYKPVIYTIQRLPEQSI
ncbi:hypothetical protein [Ketogulonicigenium vulgare]|uniref:hypothetical protein n=1 Tax=Ketogulonicigenium vulgare TaxID=92945 RepID=UPI0023594458|nr:hypothetical protein [Ketogulonicigenium vulgare]